MQKGILFLAIFSVFHVLAPSLSIAADAKPVLVTKSVPGSAGFNEKVVLTVKNLETLADKASKQGKKIIPYIDGLPLSGITTFQRNGEHIEFVLRRTDEAKETWSNLVTQRASMFANEVVISIGIEGGVPVPTDVTSFELKIVNKEWLIVCSVAVLALLLLFFWLACKSNIIRDAGINPDGDKRKPFSIGRSQMAFWFFLVITSYPFIWLITGELGSITGAILGLMGISAGTALGATVIDTSKRNASSNSKSRLDAEQTSLNERIKELEAAINTQPAPSNTDALQAELDRKRIRLNEVKQELSKIPSIVQARISRGFITDVISDVNGVSFHRFQILAWTIVLGIIFIAEVYTNLRMPEFNETLLALMGVSSGTYIGFKFPEPDKA